MRTEAVLLLAVMAAGCAGGPQPRTDMTTIPAAPPGPACDAGQALSPGDCALPADVRVFLQDRALCDHFRGEPWPSSDSAADRERRRAIMDGLRSHCAGTDSRLAALRGLHAADARVAARLAGFESRIED